MAWVACSWYLLFWLWSWILDGLIYVKLWKKVWLVDVLRVKVWAAPPKLPCKTGACVHGGYPWTIHQNDKFSTGNHHWGEHLCDDSRRHLHVRRVELHFASVWGRRRNLSALDIQGQPTCLFINHGQPISIKNVLCSSTSRNTTVVIKTQALDVQSPTKQRSPAQMIRTLNPAWATHWWVRVGAGHWRAFTNPHSWGLQIANVQYVPWKLESNVWLIPIGYWIHAAAQKDHDLCALTCNNWQ